MSSSKKKSSHMFQKSLCHSGIILGSVCLKSHRSSTIRFSIALSRAPNGNSRGSWDISKTHACCCADVLAVEDLTLISSEAVGSRAVPAPTMYSGLPFSPASRSQGPVWASMSLSYGQRPGVEGVDTASWGRSRPRIAQRTGNEPLGLRK